MTNITFISDTHGRHGRLGELKGGDILIHAGDVSNIGNLPQLADFMKWFADQPYDHKVFIAGNHDWGFENYLGTEDIQDLIHDFRYDVTFLQDSYTEINGIKIYGSPWQPRFFNWAFNLDRNSDELNSKWEMIPDDTDILITHGPAHGMLDRVQGEVIHLGCELLAEHIKNRVKPIVHVCGHIHSGRGYRYDGTTHYINASILDERYNVAYEPFYVTFDKQSRDIRHELDYEKVHKR